MCENEIKETEVTVEPETIVEEPEIREPESISGEPEITELEPVPAEPEDQKPESDGEIIYANDVIATIAAIAAQEVEGIASMGGESGWLFSKKSITKGIKVEVGNEEVCVDAYINARYGFRIREVCENLQYAIKTAIETMTSLRVVEVNVYVQSVVFDKPEEPEKKAEKIEKAEEKTPAEVVAEPVESTPEAEAEEELTVEADPEDEPEAEAEPEPEPETEQPAAEETSELSEETNLEPDVVD